MDKKTLGYAVSGSPLFCFMIGAIGKEGMLDTIRRYAQIEKELFERKVEDEDEMEVSNTYFTPHTDSQTKTVARLFQEFAEEYSETDDQAAFYVDVLTAMYYRKYDLLIAAVTKMIENHEEVDDGQGTESGDQGDGA